MADKEDKKYRLQMTELDEQRQKIAMQDAKVALDQGYLKLKAQFEIDYNKLKTDYERAVLSHALASAAVAYQKTLQDKTFDS